MTLEETTEILRNMLPVVSENLTEYEACFYNPNARKRSWLHVANFIENVVLFFTNIDDTKVEYRYKCNIAAYRPTRVQNFSIKRWHDKAAVKFSKKEFKESLSNTLPYIGAGITSYDTTITIPSLYPRLISLAIETEEFTTGLKIYDEFFVALVENKMTLKLIGVAEPKIWYLTKMLMNSTWYAFLSDSLKCSAKLPDYTPLDDYDEFLRSQSRSHLLEAADIDIFILPSKNVEAVLAKLKPLGLIGVPKQKEM